MSDELILASDFFTDVRGVLATARRVTYPAVDSTNVS
jgi:hypothetical protein